MFDELARPIWSCATASGFGSAFFLYLTVPYCTKRIHTQYKILQILTTHEVGVFEKVIWVRETMTNLAPGGRAFNHPPELQLPVLVW